MTDNTEPNLDKILRGVADGSYTPHWQDERLVLTVPEAKQKIEALISAQVAKAEALLINNIDNALDDIEGTASGRYYPFMDTKSRLSTIQEIANELKQRS